MRDSVFKLKESKLTLDIKEIRFRMRVAKHCHRLPREVAKATSLETFKVSLGGTLSNLT